MTVDESPTALFRHACAVYARMEAESKEEIIEGTSVRVYEGALTRLITVDLDLAMPYFTQVRSAILGMGCAIQLKRGGGSGLSRWELKKAPTLEDFERWNTSSTRLSQTKSKQSVLAQQVRDLDSRVSRVEKTLNALLDSGREG